MKNCVSNFRYILLLTALVFVSSAALSHAQTPAFLRTLAIGAEGPDVVALQKYLGVSPTGYFGVLTAAAVARFQEKYAAEVLFPQGLSRGTGNVGPATLAALNKYSLPAQAAISASTAPAAPVMQAISTPSPVVVPASGPNTKNLDKFLDSMARVSAKNGVSQARIDVLKREIIKQATGTTTDFKQQFIDQVKAKTAAERAAMSPLALAVDALVQAGKDFIGLKDAEAALDLPFGGELYYTFPCYCSGTVYITISSLAPTYVSTLTYTPFSQAYLSYNIPYTEWLLGKYTPGVGLCLMPAVPSCYPIVAEGMIGPMVGSSAF